MSSWNTAKNINLFRYPIPGGSGVLSMKALAQHVENREDLEPNTSYIGYNEKRSLLTILWVRPDGRHTLTKEYARGRVYDIEKHLMHRLRQGALTRSQAEKVTDFPIARAKKAKS